MYIPGYLTYSFVLLASLACILLSAQYAIRYASNIAKELGLAKYIIGFIVVALISIIPETLVAIMSAREGVASFGLATLFGSNVADLTVVIAIILFANGRSIQVESQVLKNNELYIASLLLPIVLGLDGMYSRLDGAFLFSVGAFFHIWLYSKHRAGGTPVLTGRNHAAVARNFFLLLFCMGLILLGAHFTVTASTALALHIGIPVTLIGLIVVGLGTTMPELFFSLSALRKHKDSLALGDILGTVITDATAVVGLVAIVSPFSFHPKIVSVTGMFMVMSGLLVFYFMRSGKRITRKEGAALLVLYALFICIEIIASRL